MSKPPKLDLKAIIAGGNDAATAAAPAVDDTPATPPTAPMVIPMTTPRPAGRTAATRGAGQGTLKERAHQLSLYLEPGVYEQLRELAFTERTKIHPLLIEAIDLLFKKRGLKSVKQLETRDTPGQRITG